MPDAVVARMWMRCQGHVAHGTSRLHTSVRSLRLHHLGPAALGSVNRIETCTSVCNLYIDTCNQLILLWLGYHAHVSTLTYHTHVT